MSHKLTRAGGLGAVALACALWGSASAGDVEGDDSRGADGRHRAIASAVLRDPGGAFVGKVVFTLAHHATFVVVSAHLAAGTDGIHGFHVHANADGAGCIADPNADPSTWFVSVGGHFNPGGGTHGEHAGDMPALFFTEDGRAEMTFITDRFTPEEIIGKAVILHAAPDNYGNVPVGTAQNQYTPNSAAATTLTQATGNAGVRLACGVIQ